MRKGLTHEDHVPVADALRAALEVAVSKAPAKLVLAVSGGRDSMALLHAMARWAPESIAAIATYDHGSGASATDAAALVAAEARRLGLTVIRERARSIVPTEDAWRTARWSFLKRVARGYKASVATAHTRDDQIETIVLRLMRGTGARGLAALAAPSSVIRPWLPLARHEVAQWATAEGIPHVEDPTNHTHQYFRSRVRIDLLPALERVHPGFGEEMLGLGYRAAALRHDVEALVNTFAIQPAPAGTPPSSMRFEAAHLAGVGDEGLAVLWPALMARCGVALNQRGTTALVRFTSESRLGTRLELAGHASVIRYRESGREWFEMRPGRDRRSTARATGWERPVSTPAGAFRAVNPVQAAQIILPPSFGQWRFTRGDGKNRSTGATVTNPESDLWWFAVPEGVRCEVRHWSAGDRIITPGAPAGRRVARYFSEAHVPPVDRPLWPVVLIGEDIVWVPGVCRSPAAPNRPGRPAEIWYRCEREHG
ncbi:MAG: tRNA lysidine(34) synthetase TilS [Gemmatimonas sp.]